MREKEEAILIVDDNEMNREMLSRRLRKSGYQTDLATGGQEGITKIQEGEFDLILLDIMMPEINGLEVLQQVRKHHTAIELPVIMVTAKEDTQGVIEALELGANDYITKPIDFPVALARIRSQLSCKRAEKALKESEERYRDLFDNAHDLIQIISPEGGFLYVNRAWYQRLEYEPQEIDNYNILDIVHPDERGDFLDHYHTSLQQETPTSFEITLMSKSGEKVYVEAGMSCRIQDGKHLFTRAIFHDITERKKIEEMKNEFVSMVSHELRTPLTSIRGSLGLLNGGVTGELSAQAKNLINIAYNNSERLIRLINDILDIEKIESGKMVMKLTPQRLSHLLQNAIEANEGFARQYNVKLALNNSVDEAIVQVDSDRFAQVMTNLISNAVKYSPSEAEVVIHAQRIQDKIKIAVKDKGPGIPEEFQERIFQKFAQADSSTTRRKGGSGLGLSISKAIIERFAGKIDFVTKADQGSTFYFYLPEWQEQRHQDQEQKVLTKKQDCKSSGNRQPSILYLEPDQDVAQVMSTLLRDFAQVTRVEDLDATKECLQNQNFDLVILESELPEIPAGDLLENLSPYLSFFTPVMFLCARDISIKKNQRVKAILTKSLVTNEKFIETVRGVLEETL